jgi:hypothetical protein
VNIGNIIVEISDCELHSPFFPFGTRP